MKLRAPLRIAEVAELLGWSAKRTKRWLWRLHVESGRTLLEGGPSPEGSTPYLVTITALYRVRPDLFEPPPGLESRIDELENEKAKDRDQLHQLAIIVGNLRRDRPKSLLRVA